MCAYPWDYSSSSASLFAAQSESYYRCFISWSVSSRSVISATKCHLRFPHVSTHKWEITKIFSWSCHVIIFKNVMKSTVKRFYAIESRKLLLLGLQRCQRSVVVQYFGSWCNRIADNLPQYMHPTLPVVTPFVFEPAYRCHVVLVVPTIASVQR